MNIFKQSKKFEEICFDHSQDMEPTRENLDKLIKFRKLSRALNKFRGGHWYKNWAYVDGQELRMLKLLKSKL